MQINPFEDDWRWATEVACAYGCDRGKKMPLHLPILGLFKSAMNNNDPESTTEEQLRALFEQHADQSLLKQFFEDRAALVIETNDELELECTAIGV